MNSGLEILRQEAACNQLVGQISTGFWAPYGGCMIGRNKTTALLSNLDVPNPGLARYMSYLDEARYTKDLHTGTSSGQRVSKALSGRGPEV
jgi:hypothetical protein